MKRRRQNRQTYHDCDFSDYCNCDDCKFCDCHDSSCPIIGPKGPRGPQGPPGLTGPGLVCDSGNNLISGGATADAAAERNTVYGCQAGAGTTLMHNDRVLIGFEAGFTGGASGSIAVGLQSGKENQGFEAVGIGFRSGQNNQGSTTVAVGSLAGINNQGNSSVAIGFAAGADNQKTSSVAIGNEAGSNDQGDHSVAIGLIAGRVSQGDESVAIGRAAGNNDQGDHSVAIGNEAGEQLQSKGCVAIGCQAGCLVQAGGSVAIGSYAGNISQGNNAVAIGHRSGARMQAPNSIALNASGVELNPGESGFFVNPIRELTDPTNLAPLRYMPDTKEIVYLDPSLTKMNMDIDHKASLVEDVYYRGEDYIPEDSDFIEIEIPNYTDLTDVTVQLTAIYNGSVRVLNCDRVIDGKFKVYGEPGPFYWRVHGKHKDI